MSALRRLGSRIVTFFRTAPPALRSAPFWKSTGTIVVTLLLGTGVITPEHQGNALAVVQTAALVVAGVVTVGYTIAHHHYRAAVESGKKVLQTVTHVDTPTGRTTTVTTQGPVGSIPAQTNVASAAP